MVKQYQNIGGNKHKRPARFVLVFCDIDANELLGSYFITSCKNNVDMQTYYYIQMGTLVSEAGISGKGK